MQRLHETNEQRSWLLFMPNRKTKYQGKKYDKVKKMIEEWNDEIRNYKSCSDRMDELWDALIAFLNNYSRI